VLTIFAVPKPFRGHIGIIQMNALQSWIRLSPPCDIILFGNEEGISEAASRLSVRHIPDVKLNEYKTPLLDDVFSKAQQNSVYDTMCYINADIILMSDFIRAVEHVRGKKKAFLMVGRRWNVNLEHYLDFSQSNWEEQLRTYVLKCGTPTPPEWIDYFVFNRGLYSDLLPFALGRAAFDNWLLWKAYSLKAQVIDASQATMVVHQNHDYSHHPQGKNGVWEGMEASHNRELMGGWHHCLTLDDATHLLRYSGVKPNLSTKRLIRMIWTRRYLWLIGRILPILNPTTTFKRIIN